MFDDAPLQDDAPRIKQLSVFLPNRLGALLGVNRALESYGLNIRALTIMEAADHAVARLVVDRPTLAAEVLRGQDYSVFETDMLGVALPPEGGIRKVLSALLMAELNVHYVYSLLASGATQRVLAVHVEDLDAATRVLHEHSMELIGQDLLE